MLYRWVLKNHVNTDDLKQLQSLLNINPILIKLLINRKLNSIKEINSFLERGGILAWGIVPTSVPVSEYKLFYQESAESLLEKLAHLFNHFQKKGISRGLLEKQMMVTPSCGMKTLTGADARAVLKLLYEIHQKLNCTPDITRERPSISKTQY